MLGIKVRFGDETLAQIDSDTEVIKLITEFRDKLKSRNPVLRLDHSNGSRLYVLLSDRWCSASFESREWDVYHIINSVSNYVESNESVRFMHGNHATYIQRKNCVNFDVIRNVISEFLKAGKLPETVARWEHWGKIEPYT